jgi:NAD(P)-dependent dehydrogenase (short-subunit alcohol dehydrogenase family)
MICDVDETGLKETERELQGLGRTVLARRTDVANRHEMRELAAVVHERVEAVDILVNNAGVGLGGSFVDTSLEDWDWIIGINLWGVIHGCHFFVPPMIARAQGGHVVNVSSAAGYVATEPLAAYCTTKFAVFGLSEALREEMSRAGIGVTTVCPGIINTPITQTSRIRGPLASDQARQRMVDFYRRRNYGPERVARNILKAIQRNRAVAPISPEAWGMYFFKRFFPTLLAAFNRRVNERTRRELEDVAGG